MTDTTAIVNRLRFLSNGLTPLAESNVMSDAATEIERLRKKLDVVSMSIRFANAEIKQLRAERDEARREVCRCLGNPPIVNIAEGIATERGWDCFKEET